MVCLVRNVVGLLLLLLVEWFLVEVLFIGWFFFSCYLVLVLWLLWLFLVVCLGWCYLGWCVCFWYSWELVCWVVVLLIVCWVCWMLVGMVGCCVLGILVCWLVGWYLGMGFLGLGWYFVGLFVDVVCVLFSLVVLVCFVVCCGCWLVVGRGFCVLGCFRWFFGVVKCFLYDYGWIVLLGWWCGLVFVLGIFVFVVMVMLVVIVSGICCFLFGVWLVVWIRLLVLVWCFVCCFVGGCYGGLLWLFWLVRLDVGSGFGGWEVWFCWCWCVCCWRLSGWFVCYFRFVNVWGCCWFLWRSVGSFFLGCFSLVVGVLGGMLLCLCWLVSCVGFW